MINVVIAYDNKNHTLGQYFEDCKKDIVDFFEEQQEIEKSYTEIHSTLCNAAYIDMKIPQLNNNPFIFIAYTHGKDDGLRCNGNSFISTSNSNHFENSLFYSTACLVGKKLAPDLVNKGCKVFIGFNEESEIPEEASCLQTFIECDNFALKMLISKEGTSVGKAFESMKNHYTRQIDHLIDFGEPFYAATLTANREALICLGDKNLKKEDFYLPT